MSPPSRDELECEAKAIADACGKEKTKKLEPCDAPPKGKEKENLDRARGVQQTAK